VSCANLSWVTDMHQTWGSSPIRASIDVDIISHHRFQKSRRDFQDTLLPCYNLTFQYPVLRTTMSIPPLTLTSLCEDVLLIIFSFLSNPLSSEPSTSLKDLSLVSHHFHTLLTPHLFKTIHINKPLSQLPSLSRAAHHTQTFKLDMFGSLWWWCSGSYTSDSDALAIFTCIRSLENLKNLEVSMMKRSIDIFASAFSGPHCASTFALKNVQILEVSGSAAFLAAHCPNLVSLTVKEESEVDAYTPLPIRLLPLHPNFTLLPEQLTSFDAPATWTAAELACVTTLFPNLTTLRMRSDTYGYHTPLPAVMSILSSLKHLHTLHLVKVAYLGTGHAQQVLFLRRTVQARSAEEYRKELWKRSEEARIQAEDEIVRCAFESMAALKVCWVGDLRVARRCLDTQSWNWERAYDDYDVPFTRARQDSGFAQGLIG
jgi:hypothetical protein